MSSKSPICLFVYNRPGHCLKTIEALKNNLFASESELFIFSDGAKNEEDEKKVNEVRDLIKNISGFKKVHVIKRLENWGLMKSLITGVSDVVGKYGKVIVLEDDIKTAPYFLKYMNDALDDYKNTQVMHINGYLYPIQGTIENVFLSRISCPWGWATWKEAWDKYHNNSELLLDKLKRSGKLNYMDLDGDFHFSSMLHENTRTNAGIWDVNWYASIVLSDGLCLYPNISLVQNIGNDASGENCDASDVYKVKICNHPILVVSNLFENKKGYLLLKYFFLSIKPSFTKKIKTRFKYLIKLLLTKIIGFKKKN